MEAALVNCLAVTECTARTFLVFYCQWQGLRAALVTPRGLFVLSSTEVMPAITASNLGEVRAFLSECKANVHFATRQFSLSGRLLGGGACCSTAEGLSQQAKKTGKWSEAMRRISQASDKVSAKADLQQVRLYLADPTLEKFKDLIDDMARIAWASTSAKSALIKELLRAAEKLYLVSQTDGLESVQLCGSVLAEFRMLKNRLISEEAEDAFNHCKAAIIVSALEEISEGQKAPEIAVIRTALGTGTIPADFDFQAQVFSESLVAASLQLRLVAKWKEMRHVFDQKSANLCECPWEIQGVLAHILLRLPIPEEREEWESYFVRFLEPLLMQTSGQYSWKVRAVATSALDWFLTHSAPESAKELASLSIFKALDSEPHPGVLRLLKQLPRTYLNPSIICTALADAGTGGLYNLKTRELLGIQHAVLHGTARAVASLKGTMIITGGLLNPKRTFEIDVNSLQVRELATLNEERFWHGACLVGHEIVVCGGKSTPDGPALASSEKLLSDKWVTLAHMTCARESHSCAAWGTSVYAVGGLGSPEAATTVEVLKHLVWTRLPLNLPRPILVPGVYLKSEDEMILGGGKTDTAVADVILLSLNSGAIQPLRSLPHPSAFSSDLVEMRDNLLVFLSSESREMFEFDFNSDSWSTREY